MRTEKSRRGDNFPSHIVLLPFLCLLIRMAKNRGFFLSYTALKLKSAINSGQSVALCKYGGKWGVGRHQPLLKCALM